jgi:hypothetical protein
VRFRAANGAERYWQFRTKSPSEDPCHYHRHLSCPAVASRRLSEMKIEREGIIKGAAGLFILDTYERRQVGSSPVVDTVSFPSFQLPTLPLTSRTRSNRA